MVNQKGQAAVTDALIFLTILGVVSTMIMTSSIQYGTTIMDGVQHNYEKTYLDSALKTLLIANNGRDGNDFFNSVVNDGVMTKIMEDFDELKDNEKLPENTQNMIFNTLNRIFLFMPNKGYLFAIIQNQENNQNKDIKPVFVGIKTLYGKVNNDNITNPEGYVYLSCMPITPTTNIQEYLSKHSLNLSITTSKIQLYKNLINEADTKNYNADIFLGMWNLIVDFNDGEPKNNLQNSPEYIKDLNCVKFKTEEFS